GAGRALEARLQAWKPAPPAPGLRAGPALSASDSPDSSPGSASGPGLKRLVRRRLWMGGALQDCSDYARWRRPFERVLARDHFVQNQTEGEGIAAWAGLNAADLLGRHVLQRAKDGALGRQPRIKRRVIDCYGLVDFRQPEVEHLHPTTPRHQNIGGFQISMCDVVRMRRVERRSNLRRVLQRLIQRQRTL